MAFIGTVQYKVSAKIYIPLKIYLSPPKKNLAYSQENGKMNQGQKIYAKSMVERRKWHIFAAPPQIASWQCFYLENHVDVNGNIRTNCSVRTNCKVMPNCNEPPTGWYGHWPEATLLCDCVMHVPHSIGKYCVHNSCHHWFGCKNSSNSMVERYWFNMLVQQHGQARPSIVQHGPTGPAWSSTHNGDQRNLVPQTDVQQQKRDIVMSTKLRIVAKSVLFWNVGMRWIVCLSVVPLVWSNMQSCSGEEIFSEATFTS